LSGLKQFHIAAVIHWRGYAASTHNAPGGSGGRAAKHWRLKIHRQPVDVMAQITDNRYEQAGGKNDAVQPALF